MPARARQLNTKKAYTSLLAATTALALNFWAWTILSPLGTRYADELSLQPVALALLLAIPVIVGSLGRVVFGALTDKFGGRFMFAAVCVLQAAVVSVLSFAGDYTSLVAAAVFLGIGGASFVVGVPFVSAWFPSAKRGLALGIYSVGNAGTALAGFFTPRLDDAIGRKQTFFLVALLLAVMAMVFAFKIKNAPGWRASTASPLTQIKNASENRMTWDLAAVYAITFGAFVAFGVYLPVLLKVAYDLPATDAASRAAGFILLATLARPIGGWLSDKLGGKPVIRISLAAIAVLAAYLALQPDLRVQTTAVYLTLAAALGTANGAVFALVGKLVKAGSVGSVTGIIGAVGGLGGFLPPLVLGITYERTHSYAVALFLLAASSLAILFYANYRFRDSMYRVRI
jgi:NNP family nitrate/nitrite transporter-like MFS transporter